MIKDNVMKIRVQIAEACRTAGRTPEEIALVAVTKFVPLEGIQEAIEAGITHIAENRVQEAELKFPALTAKDPGLTTHLIGHLQSNKAKDAAKVVSLIHSVDSLKLAQEIDKQAAKLGKTVDILVQFNTAREEQKFGAQPEEACGLIEGISHLSNVRIQGLMAMAPLVDDQGIIRKTFADLRALKESIAQQFKGHSRVQMQILSMGMSGDLKIAIEEGSTMIRVGSAIFK